MISRGVGEERGGVKRNAAELLSGVKSDSVGGTQNTCAVFTY